MLQIAFLLVSTNSTFSRFPAWWCIIAPFTCSDPRVPQSYSTLRFFALTRAWAEKWTKVVSGLLRVHLRYASISRWTGDESMRSRLVFWSVWNNYPVFRPSWFEEERALTRRIGTFAHSLVSPLLNRCRFSTSPLSELEYTFSSTAVSSGAFRASPRRVSLQKQAY